MKTVLEMAREAGAGEPESLYGRTDYVVMTRSELVRFTELIRADAIAEEREACAKVCDVTVLGDEYLTAVLNTYADAIRARSNT